MPRTPRLGALGVLLLAGATAAHGARQEKPAAFTLVNPAKDIRVISDRDEPVLDYFRRHRVIIGGVTPQPLAKVLGAKEPLPQFFVNYASHNDDPTKGSTFGAYLEVAPPSAAVAKLLMEHQKKGQGLTLILRRDDQKPARYHVVGCTERPSVGFFDNEKKNAADGCSQKDLCFRGEPKK